MAMVDMVMVDTVLHLSLSPSLITDMVDHSLTAMDTTLVDMERETLRPSQGTAMVPEATPTDPHKAWVMEDTAMERDLLMLSQDMESPPATNTDHHRDFPDMEVTDMVDMVMVDTVMERDLLMLSQDMES